MSVYHVAIGHILLNIRFSAVESIAMKHSDVEFIITHTYVDTPGSGRTPTVTDAYPNHPSNVNHAEDGLRVVREGSIWSVQKIEE